MTRLRLLPLILALAAPAYAAGPDDDDLFGDDDEEEEAKPDRIDEGDDLNFEDDEEDDIDFTKDPDEEDGDEEDEEEVDLLGEEEEEVPEGGDTAAIYRAAQTRIGKLDNDEAIQEWENYLAQYPNSVFRKRVQEDIDSLMENLYGTKIKRDTGPVDAQDQEVRLAHPLTLENINPRTRGRVGFDWGLPNFLSMFADYEYAVRRDFSVHGGVRRHYLYGASVEPGVRWAFVKSSRTQTVVSALADFHLLTNPGFPALRPQLAVGKIVGDKVHLQAQGGADIELRKDGGVPILGGANVSYRAADTVAAVIEGRLQMKPVGDDLFMFNTLVFGMKFFPGGKRLARPDAVEVNMSGAAPVATNIWQDHFGAIGIQTNAWMDDF